MMMIDIIIIFILMVTVSYRPLHLSHDVHDGASEMHSVDDYIEELYAFVTDRVSNLHPRINEVLMKDMKERMNIIEDSIFLISYFEDVSFVCRKIWT